MNSKIHVALSILLACEVLQAQTRWIGTWGAAPSPQLGDTLKMEAQKLRFDNQTLREIVHLSAGSSTIRIRLSNAYGSDDVKIGSAHLALPAGKSAIIPDSDRILTFGGKRDVVVPSNSVVLSDPVDFAVPADHDLAISIYLPNTTMGAGIHYSAEQTSYIGTGDMTGTAVMQNAASITSWVFLSGVDALVADSGATIAAFGDSITDGARSTLDANQRWPNLLADRLNAEKRNNLGVIDEGIGGNRVLHDALAATIEFGVNALSRFTRDVLAQPGVKYVIVLEGINDIGHAGTSAPPSQEVSAEQIIAGLKQLIEQAHENGLKILGGTLTPFEGTTYPGYFKPDKELKRKAVNDWIRNSHSFDAVIDFDKAIRDPQHPDRMLPQYDGGDHLHPGDAGYQAMADAIDLNLFN